MGRGAQNLGARGAFWSRFQERSFAQQQLSFSRALTCAVALQQESEEDSLMYATEEKSTCQVEEREGE